MAEFRWVLLGLGLIALLAIYLFSLYRARGPAPSRDKSKPRREPSIGESPDESPRESGAAAAGEGEPILASDTQKVPEKVVTIRLMSRGKPGFSGDRLILALRRAGLRHGRFGIFHAHGDEDQEHVLFSVANLVEPGIFDLSALKGSKLPGISLFLVLPGPTDPGAALEAMLDTAHRLAADLEGDLLDEQGSTLSVQRERYIRDEVQQFLRQYSASTASRGPVV